MKLWFASIKIISFWYSFELHSQQIDNSILIKNKRKKKVKKGNKNLYNGENVRAALDWYKMKSWK